MTQSVTFEFKPGQDVMITAYGLNYKGRVVGCFYTKAGIEFKVEYAAEGKVETMYCETDQLEALS